MVNHLKITNKIQLLDYYLREIFLGHFFELLAAVGGSYYLIKVPDVKTITKIFVYFLWFILFVEIIGLYALFNYFNYSYFEFLIGTPFEDNYWLYNSLHVVSYMVYFYFFIEQLKTNRIRKYLTFMAWFFFATSILFLVFSGVFFVNYSFYSIIVGTIILILCIAAYYYQMLTSDTILSFQKNPAFYISIGALIWHVVVTPLLIYGKYYSTTSPEFIKMYGLILGSANMFLYGIFFFGFIICSRKNPGKLSLFEVDGGR